MSYYKGSVCRFRYGCRLGVFVRDGARGAAGESCVPRTACVQFVMDPMRKQGETKGYDGLFFVQLARVLFNGALFSQVEGKVCLEVGVVKGGGFARHSSVDGKSG